MNLAQVKKSVQKNNSHKRRKKKSEERQEVLGRILRKINRTDLMSLLDFTGLKVSKIED